MGLTNTAKVLVCVLATLIVVGYTGLIRETTLTAADPVILATEGVQITTG